MKTLIKKKYLQPQFISFPLPQVQTFITSITTTTTCQPQPPQASGELPSRNRIPTTTTTNTATSLSSPRSSSATTAVDSRMSALVTILNKLPVQKRGCWGGSMLPVIGYGGVPPAAAGAGKNLCSCCHLE